ncbi:MAG TPA: dipeptidase PepV [Methanoregulaceae archaeon]|nr:dipeptidase PepV [Methanoregulaceae archaeon]
MDSPEFLIDQCIEDLREKIISSVCEIVRIRSVAGDPTVSAPFGTGPAEVLSKVLELAGSLGFRTVNLENYAGYAEFGNGPEYIGVLGHLDTVPEGNGWNHPPFGGEIVDGKIFGRGALDDKGPILAALFGLTSIKESGLVMGKKVRIIFGTDEETGSHDMNHYITKEPPPVSGFTPDAEFPVVFAEKGILWFEFLGHYPDVAHAGLQVLSIRGGVAANMVPDFASAVILTDHPGKIIDGCRIFAENTGYSISAEGEGNQVIIRCRGLAAHGSTPESGRNAIMRLMSYLGSLPLDPEGIGRIIHFFNSIIGSDYSGSLLGLDIADAISGSLTLNIGKIEVSGGVFRLTADIRYPVTVPAERITSSVTHSLNGTGIDVTLIKHDPPLNFPPESELILTLRSIYKDFCGDSSPPVAIGGGTYARRLPNIVAFGPYRPGQKPPIHGADEYISCDDLISDAKIYARAIYRLARNPGKI